MKRYVSLSLLVCASIAHADNKDKADTLFKQGKKAMAEKRYADACESFEKSMKLDPGIGAQLNIAKCYEDWGKLGRAYEAYLAAEQQARDAKDPREPKIHELVVAIEPSVPHLTIKPPKEAPSDLVVMLDSQKLDKLGEAIVVDPGPHTIEWSITGSEKKDKTVPVDRGADSEVTLDMPKVAAKGADSGKAAAATGTPPGRNQRIAGMAVAGGGVVAIGVSSYLTLSARSRYKDALDAHCGGMTNNCDETGLEITHDARSTANKATIVFIVGAAMVGGGAALYFLAPKTAPTSEKQALYVTPAIGPDGVGAVVGGRF
jgi:tetratricopeptide (TPR) repeat protein